MFPTIAGIAIIAAVTYILGLYSGAYMFPMIAPEPCPGLTPEEKKLIAELHEMIYAEYSDNLFKNQCNDDLDAYLDSLDEESTIPDNGHSAHCVAAIDVQKSDIHWMSGTCMYPENTRWSVNWEPRTRGGFEYAITNFVENTAYPYRGYVFVWGERRNHTWDPSGRIINDMYESKYDIIPVKEDNDA
jgi:hypothetical protein